MVPPRAISFPVRWPEGSRRLADTVIVGKTRKRVYAIACHDNSAFRPCPATTHLGQEAGANYGRREKERGLAASFPVETRRR